MAKSRVSYLCRQCGGVQAQWMGKCPDCGTWDALEKYIEPKAPKSGAGGMLADESTGEPDDRVSRTPVAEPLTAVKAGEVSRLSTGIGELDRVLGGGLVLGEASAEGDSDGLAEASGEDDGLGLGEPLEDGVTAGGGMLGPLNMSVPCSHERTTSRLSGQARVAALALGPLRFRHARLPELAPAAAAH